MFNSTSIVEGSAVALFLEVVFLQFLIFTSIDAKQLLISGKLQSLTKRLTNFLRCSLIVTKRFALIAFWVFGSVQSTLALYIKLNVRVCSTGPAGACVVTESEREK